MKRIFWSLAGVAWFFGHLDYGVSGASALTVDETWDLSRMWAEAKYQNRKDD